MLPNGKVQSNNDAEMVHNLTCIKQRVKTIVRLWLFCQQWHFTVGGYFAIRRL